MNTLTIDIVTLYYSIKYSETWFYYVVFSITLYYFAVIIFQRNLAGFKSMHDSRKPGLANQLTTVVSLPDTLVANEAPVISPEEFKYTGELFRLRDKMEQLMKEENLYQEPELTLADLAKKLQTNSSVLSRVINQCFMLNFNDYINKYRVEDVIAKMSNPKFSNQTLLSIAFDAGFNSKSTFNRAFLKFKETTPRYYYQSLNIENNSN
jgi:AraC-like DNA-binding protein